MTFLPLLLLAAAGSQAVFNGVIEVERAEWRHLPVRVTEAKAIVNCDFEAEGASELRVVWIALKDLEAFRLERRDRIIAATAYGPFGRLRHFAPSPGMYALVVEHSGSTQATARVKMRVSLDPPPKPRYASPGRRLAVILLSGVFFFGVVTISAYKLRRGLR